jgi:hypothetical protein
MRVTRETQAAVAEAAWAVAERHGTFGYAEISAETKICMDQATRIVQGWVKAGAVELVQAGIGKRNLWRVRPDYLPPLVVAPRGPADNLWTAMRRLRSFTATDLSAHATAEAVTVTVSDAAEYCRALLAAGYLAVVRKAAPDRKREAIYRLVKDTGPRPPRERRVRAVVDANTEQVIVIGGAA